MDLDFSPVWQGWPDLLRGALVTVEITACALALAACWACWSASAG
jgi:polar amino acid transport system permease protein